MITKPNKRPHTHLRYRPEGYLSARVGVQVISLIV